MLTTRIAALHFAPDARGPGRARWPRASRAGDVHLTGNTVIDALLPDGAAGLPVPHAGARRARSGPPAGAGDHPPPGELRRAAPVHLRGDPRSWRSGFPSSQFVLPVHPNPEVKRTVEELLCDLPGMHLIPPVDYLEFVHLMARADLVLTDSGGVQEEAPSLGKPVLVLREVTERPEGVDAGTARRGGHRPRRGSWRPPPSC